MPKKPDKPASADESPDLDEVPELEDVVEPRYGDEPAPPPNYDLFVGNGIDLEALHEKLMARMHDEIDIVVAELQVALEETVRRHFDVRLRERLPAILDEVLGRREDEPE